MRKVYEAASVNEAEILCSLLRAEGVAAFVFDVNTFALAGSNPMVWPSVWISNDHAYSLARSILARFEQQSRHAAVAEDWVCRCGEVLADSFDQCWRCSSERPPKHEAQRP